MHISRLTSCSDPIYPLTIEWDSKLSGRSSQTEFTEITQLSSWRRISLHLWDKPRDPTVYGNLEVDMRRAKQYLAEANEIRPDVQVRVIHLVVAAIAKALAAYPEANAIIARRRIFMRSTVDVYCQVATDHGDDLSGVKIPNADTLSPFEIAVQLAERAKRVREKRDSGSEQTKRTVANVPRSLLGWVLGAVEYLSYDWLLDLTRVGIPFDQFGSAMVSNIGSFGIGNGLAPLVPASRVPIVLLVGQVKDKPVAENGEVIVAPSLTIGCTFDHRLIDGYQAGKMAKIVIDSVNDPREAFGPPDPPSPPN